jgi:aspartate-semialdehyde dehydrogenase
MSATLEFAPDSARPAGPRRLTAPVKIAIVGATGAVGSQMVACLQRRGFPVASLRLLASAASRGRTLPFRSETVPVTALSEPALEGVDLALFAAGAEVARDYAPVALAAGAVVIDNSSAFRMDPDTPLVVPEVNGRAALAHRGLIANPNCCAVVAVMALAPLRALSRIRRVIAATYQAASGAGADAMAELRESTEAYLHGRPYQRQALAHPYAFNLFSHDSPVDPETGCNDEEAKVAQELRKLLGDEALGVGVTCVRVPVLRAHCIALTVEFEDPVEPEAARRALAAAPGVRVVDDRAANHFPMPSEASGRDEVLAGRIRRDASDPSGRSLALFLAGDQLLKGAALNAVQIAELLLAP